MAFLFSRGLCKSLSTRFPQELQRSATSRAARRLTPLLQQRNLNGASSGRPSVVPSTSHLSITHSSLPSTTVDIPYTWLRDSCRCPDCVHPSTRQKLHRTSDVPVDIGLFRNSEGHGVAVEQDSSSNSVSEKDGDWVIKVSWDRPLFRHDTSSRGITGHDPIAGASSDSSSPAHVSTYPLSFIRTHSSPELLFKFHYSDVLESRPWLRDQVNASSSLFVAYNDLQSGSEALLNAMKQLTQYGLLVVRGVPTNLPKDGQKWDLHRVSALFSEIHETFYGDVWDVINLPKDQTRNVAYTDLDLDLHMDLQYFVTPPRYQLLHCLRNRVDGGQSLFVDALEAAHELYRTDKEAFEVLATTDVGFWYMNDGHHLERKHKTFTVQGIRSSDQLPNIVAMNYAPPFQSPLPLSTPASFYPALQKFAALLRRPEARWEYLLREGDVAVFDNRRVLHARRSFSERPGGDINHKEPNRWLKGCYIQEDALKDRLRVLQAKFRKEQP